MKNLLVLSITILFVFTVTIMPQVYADTYSIKPASGSGAPGCETRGGCYFPNPLFIEEDDSVRFINTDNAAHSITSGTPDDGPDGIFDSSLVMASGMYTFKLTNSGEYPYFCMVHPWMQGTIIVKDSGGSSYTPPTTTYTPPTSSGTDWQSKYMEILSDFNDVSAKVGQLQKENTELKSQINEMQTTIDNLNVIIMEQVKVIYEWVVGE